MASVLIVNSVSLIRCVLVFLYIPLSSLCCFVGCCVAGCCWNREHRNTAHLPHSLPTNTPVQNTHTHTNSTRISAEFLHAINTVRQISGLHNDSSIYRAAWQSITHLINVLNNTAATLCFPVCCWGTSLWWAQIMYGCSTNKQIHRANYLCQQLMSLWHAVNELQLYALSKSTLIFSPNQKANMLFKHYLNGPTP